MKQYSNDNKYSEQLVSSATVIRYIGVGVLLAGLLLGFQVVQFAWGLLDDQKAVLTLAESINTHSNLDSSLNAIWKDQRVQAVLDTAAQQSGRADAVAAQASAPAQELKASYFAAWILTLMVIGLIAKVAVWTISAGGKVALYGVGQHQELKRLLRSLLREQGSSVS